MSGHPSPSAQKPGAPLGTWPGAGCSCNRHENPVAAQKGPDPGVVGADKQPLQHVTLCLVGLPGASGQLWKGAPNASGAAGEGPPGRDA